MDPAQLLERRRDRLTHVRRLPAREAVVEPWPTWVEPRVRAVFEAEGVDALWGHQAEALGHVRAGRHVVVSTGTASGKSLVFQVPALDAVAEKNNVRTTTDSVTDFVAHNASLGALTVFRTERLFDAKAI